jgi:hypothetical protein
MSQVLKVIRNNAKVIFITTSLTEVIFSDMILVCSVLPWGLVRYTAM